jgi:hypothetical protein
MIDAKRSSQVTRTQYSRCCLKRTARVRNAESASGLPDGAEYVHLEHLDQGVQRAEDATKLTMKGRSSASRSQRRSLEQDQRATGSLSDVSSRSRHRVEMTLGLY